MKKFLFLILFVVLTLILLAGCSSFRSANPKEPLDPRITNMMLCSSQPEGYRKYQELEQPLLPGSDFWVYFEFRNLSKQEVNGIESVWLILELQLKNLDSGEEWVDELANYTIDTSEEIIKNEYFWFWMWSGTRETTYEFTIILKDGFTGKSDFFTKEIEVSTKLKC
jgi:hypothetical protein